MLTNSGCDLEACASWCYKRRTICFSSDFDSEIVGKQVTSILAYDLYYFFNSYIDARSVLY